VSLVALIPEPFFSHRLLRILFSVYRPASRRFFSWLPPWTAQLLIVFLFVLSLGLALASSLGPFELPSRFDVVGTGTIFRWALRPHPVDGIWDAVVDHFFLIRWFFFSR